MAISADAMIFIDRRHSPGPHSLSATAVTTNATGGKRGGHWKSDLEKGTPCHRITFASVRKARLNTA